MPTRPTSVAKSRDVYRWRTKPYKHQVRGVKFAMSQFRKGLGVAFLFDKRTGKTKTTVDTLCVLHQKYGLRKALVIAPNRVLDTWVDEIHTHSPFRVDVIVWDAKARKNSIPPLHPAYDMQVLVTNYEAFSRPGHRTPKGHRSRADGRFKHRQLLLKWLGSDVGACVVDEGHKLKNPSAKQSTLIVSMRAMFKYRFLLTGTPVTKANRAHDIYMLWQWVNPDRFADWGANVEDFKNHTGRWISRNGFPQWVGPRKTGMDDLKAGIHTDGMVVIRDECMDLPPRLPDRIIPIKLGPSAKHYDEMATEMVTRLKNGAIAEASIPLVVTLRLSQLTSGFIGIPEPRVVRGRERMVAVAHRVGLEKLDALEEILTEETIEADDKLVVAARFKPDLDSIEALCDSLDLPHWSIRGGRGKQFSREVSSQSIVDFRKHKGAGVMIVQPSAGSMGIDLSTASEMVWFSLTSSWVDYSQMSDRIALSPRGTRHTFLIASGTVDELMYQSLQDDTNVSKYILSKPEALLRKGSRS